MTLRHYQLALGGTLLLMTALTACSGASPQSPAVVTVAAAPTSAAGSGVTPVAAVTVAVAPTQVRQPTQPPVSGRAAATTAPSGAGNAGDCKYATAAEVGAAIGRAVRVAAATEPLCAFVGTDSANPATFNIQVFRSPADIADGRTNLTQSGGVAVAGLGDDALWWAAGMTLFVHQGAAAIRFQDLSAFGGKVDSASLLPAMTQLANLTLARL